MTGMNRPHRAALALVAASLVVGACASRAPEPVAGPAATPPDIVVPAPAAPGIDGADAVLATALAQQGVPYRWAGSDPAGFDCSGLVQYAFAQHGVALPRETVDQYGVGTAVPLDAVEPGDLVFFATTTRGPSHVGIALGDNRFVHAPSEGGVVRVERLTVIYWARRILGARRVAVPATLMASTTAAPAPGATVAPETPAAGSPAEPAALPVARPAVAEPPRTVPRPAPFPGGPR
jgi:cell wall-associated NlpC family hydrolase